MFKHTTKTVAGAISTLRYRIDVNTLHSQNAPTLELNEIGRCSISLNQPFFYDAYRRNRGTGSFIIIDRISNVTVGAGMILDRKSGEDDLDLWGTESPAADRAQEKKGHVSFEERHARFGQKPCTLLLTGLTGSGKTTIAYALERRLFDEGRASAVIDGQNLRIGLTKDLGFSDHDRSENLRRSVEVARLMNKAGLICICAMVAPNREVRQRVKDVINEDELLIVHVTAPIEVCRQRDPAGLYDKADAGELANFPGISSEYEPPVDPDLVLHTDKFDVDQCVDDIFRLITSKGMFL